MAQAFDSTSLFDQDLFSDVTIKFSTREIKCHKVILCQASEYFNALCGPTSQFRESNQAVIELHDDDPTALETVLRYIYNFSYADIQKLMGKFTVATHIRVVVAAKKYLLPKLEANAVKSIGTVITIIGLNGDGTRDATKVLEVMERLMANKELDTTFESHIAVLLRKNLAALFKIARFRALLETDEGKQALCFATKAIEVGTECLSAASCDDAVPEKIVITTCRGCSAFLELYKTYMPGMRRTSYSQKPKALTMSINDTSQVGGISQVRGKRESVEPSTIEA